METSPFRQHALLVAAACAAALSLAPRLAHASEKWTCHSVGAPSTERLDADDHTLQVSTYTCTISGTRLEGFIATGTNIWELRKDASRLVSASGVMRKPGSAVVYEATGTSESIIVQGRQVGWQSVGKGTFRLATGAAEALAGKAFTFFAMPLTATTFAIESE